MRDPYLTLGVGRSATLDEIKQAYRALAKRYHPDTNPGRDDIEHRFKEVSAAYSLLSDSEKRARFDRGEIDAQGAERTTRGTYRSSTRRRPRTHDDHIHAGLDDLFAEFFGTKTQDRSQAGSTGREQARGPGPGPGGAGAGPEAHRRGSAGPNARSAASAGRSARRGSDISYTVTVSFTEAALGTSRRLQLSTGKGLDVVIPPGTGDQQKLRLRGQGMAGAEGGQPGDAIVQVHVEAHPFFVRQDWDIHVEVPITLPEAVLGARIRIPTLAGAVNVTVPPGSNTGTTLRLRGRGIPNKADGEAGDQYVKLKVVLPEKPDTDLVRFLERWSQDKTYDVRRRAGME